MDKLGFNQDWYGMQAKVLSQSDDCVVVDYGCNGRGIVKNYNLFEGMVIMTGYVDDMSTSNGVSAEYLTELHSFMNGPMVVIIAVVTFVAGIVGALIAKGVFKKHFQKAGIV